MTAAAAGRRVVVLGGGITGLAAAFYLRRARPDLQLVLLERAARLGGNIRTERGDGFVIDAGPDSFLRTKPDGVALCRELELTSELIAPSSRQVYVAHRGGLEKMPEGLVLGAPTKLLPLARTRLLSLGGKLRALGDLVARPAPPAADESIDSFLTRRIGREAAQRLAAPLLGGIYAGDVGELSIRSTFPQLVELEQRGGLIRGLRAQPRPAASPFYSLKSGMGRLIERLAEVIGGGSIRTGVNPARLSRSGECWRIELEHGEPIEASAVLLAIPAHAAARLVPDAKLAGELAAIPYLSTATVFAAFPRNGRARGLDGIGFIVPPGEGDILAGTWISSKWAARSPDDALLVRAFVGGARSSVDVAHAGDDELRALALDELARLMGPLGTPLFTRIFRYVAGNPQPVVGHGARLERVAARLGGLPGLHVAGAAYDGVGIPDCVRQARAAAARIADEIPRVT
jgi:protoporphyrinogen/coproporphyrinogen III oxidase